MHAVVDEPCSRRARGYRSAAHQIPPDEHARIAHAGGIEPGLDRAASARAPVGRRRAPRIDRRRGARRARRGARRWRPAGRRGQQYRHDRVGVELDVARSRAPPGRPASRRLDRSARRTAASWLGRAATRTSARSAERWPAALARPQPASSSATSIVLEPRLVASSSRPARPAAPPRRRRTGRGRRRGRRARRRRAPRARAARRAARRGRGASSRVGACAERRRGGVRQRVQADADRRGSRPSVPNEPANSLREVVAGDVLDHLAAGAGRPSRRSSATVIPRIRSRGAP